MIVNVKESKIAGKGVFAVQKIAEGEVILKIDDSRVVTDEDPIQADMDENVDHCDYLPDGTTVLMQSPEKYINQFRPLVCIDLPRED